MKLSLMFFNLTCLSFVIINYTEVSANLNNKQNLSCPNFGNRIKNFYLNESNFKSFIVELEVHCLYQCMIEDKCLSYNFGPSPSGRGMICELSSADRFSAKAKFLRSADFSHRGLVTRCEKNPCKNGGTCQTTVNNTSEFYCLCPAKYYGATCENKSCTIYDFEDGNLSGWLKTGTAFDNQPTYGNNVVYRKAIEASEHVGDWWIGTFEDRPNSVTPPGRAQGDIPQGTLTSPPFTITSDRISFRIGGGCEMEKTRVELVASGDVVAKATGKCVENMLENVWQVKALIGKPVQLRIIDQSSDSWGHINFDHLLEENC